MVGRSIPAGSTRLGEQRDRTRRKIYGRRRGSVVAGRRYGTDVWRRRYAEAFRPFLTASGQQQHPRQKDRLPAPSQGFCFRCWSMRSASLLSLSAAMRKLRDDSLRTVGTTSLSK